MVDTAKNDNALSGNTDDDDKNNSDDDNGKLSDKEKRVLILCIVAS